MRFEMKMAQSLYDAVEDWRRSQEDIPTRSEAVRYLIRRGLRHAGSGAFRSKLESSFNESKDDHVDRLERIASASYQEWLESQGGLSRQEPEEKSK